MTHLRLFENNFAQYTLGTMDAEDWLAQRGVLKMLLRNEAYRDAYSFLGKRWNTHFVAEVERILAEGSAAAV